MAQTIRKITKVLGQPLCLFYRAIRTMSAERPSQAIFREKRELLNSKVRHFRRSSRADDSAQVYWKPFASFRSAPQFHEDHETDW